MSVLIKNITMPKCCGDCPCFYDFISCQALSDGTDDFSASGFDEFRERLPNCPLVEVPAPHGRLIDAGDAVITLKANKRENEAKGYILAADEDEIVRWIDKLPTIIEAEEGAENEIDRR